MSDLPPPLDAQAFLSTTIRALTPTGCVVTTTDTPGLFASLPVHLVTLFPSPSADDGILETLVFDVDTYADDRATSSSLSLGLMRALTEARLAQTVFPLGHISAVSVLTRPFPPVTPSGEPKGAVHFTARYALAVRPRY